MEEKKTKILMNTLKNIVKCNNGFLVVKNFIGMFLIWSVSFFVGMGANYYYKTKKLELKSYYSTEITPSENNQVRYMAGRLLKLLHSPNLDNIEADNEEATRYMTDFMVKNNIELLQWRVKGIKLFKQMNKHSVTDVFQDIKTAIVSLDNPPEYINKSLLSEGGCYVLVKATIKGFRNIDGKEADLRTVYQLVHLIKVKPTIEKPSCWLVDSISPLD